MTAKPVQGTSDAVRLFFDEYIDRCCEVLDNTEPSAQSRVVMDCAKVAYYLAAGRKLPVIVRYAVLQLFLNEMMTHLRGGDADA